MDGVVAIATLQSIPLAKRAKSAWRVELRSRPGARRQDADERRASPLRRMERNSPVFDRAVSFNAVKRTCIASRILRSAPLAYSGAATRSARPFERSLAKR